MRFDMEYFKSDLWKNKRDKRLLIDNNKCRLCDSSDRLEVHHRPESYNKIPNESVENDLITVCKVCHDLITNRVREDRYNKKEIKYIQHIESIIDDRKSQTKPKQAISLKAFHEIGLIRKVDR